MNVNGQTQPARFASEIEEKIILQRLVVSRRRLATFHESGIGRAGARCVRIVKVELAQVCRFELHRHRAILFLSLKRRRHYSLRVIVER